MTSRFRSVRKELQSEKPELAWWTQINQRWDKTPNTMNVAEARIVPQTPREGQRKHRPHNNSQTYR